MQRLQDRRNFLRILVAGCLAAQQSLRASPVNALAIPIERRAVASSSIAAIGYHEQAQVLEIQFRSGAVYRYLAVPPAVFTAFIHAESKGRYFSARIRGKYEFHHMEEERR
jgi:hypothetical protein